MQQSDEIKQKLDIVDIIRDYLPLKAAGMNFRARCPFHREKTPSFMVSPDKQIFHCFGCGKGGDVFTFIQEIEGVDFIGALRILAPKAGVMLKRQDPKLASQRNRILDILEISRKHYHQLLLTSKLAEGTRKYLKSRGIDREIAEEWQIGFALDSWDNLSNLLKSKAFSEQEIFLAGMIAKSDTSSRFYDRFRGRIMFPINDLNGATVAFSARIMPEQEEENKMGKYINSPQTNVYDKSKIIFGLDKAKLHIKSEDLAIVAEGQMDVITAHINGHKNVIASSGTALTQDQIQIIKRYTNNIALAFDMDAAGSMAADRGAREAMKAEMNVKVIELPNGKDPDECIRKDPELWREAIANARQVMEYYFNQIFKDLDINKIENKREGVKKALPIIRQLENKIEQDYWLKYLSEIVNVDEFILREAISGIKNIKTSKREQIVKATGETKKVLSKEERTSEILLILLLKYPFLLEYSIKNINIEHIIGDNLNILYRKLLLYYNNIINNAIDANESEIINYQNFRQWLAENQNNKDIINESQLNYYDRLAFLGETDFFKYENDEAKNEAIGLIKELNKSQLVGNLRVLEKQIAEAERQKNNKHIDELMEEFRLLSEELRDYTN